MRRNLLGRIGERIVGIKHFFTQHLILHRNHCHEKDIVECFGLHSHIELLHAKGQFPHELFNGTNGVIESRLHQSRKETEAFDHSDFGGLNNETARKAHDWASTADSQKIGVQ